MPLRHHPSPLSTRAHPTVFMVVLALSVLVLLLFAVRAQ